ncbi:hypothetical protein MMC25_001631 [Agyrium rufum]|nr:hypothetical protein [Agyrium rufum]
MQSMQRKFARLLPRTADESQVALLLNDFDEADKMLAKLVDATKAWRDSWREILQTQYNLVNEFRTLFDPIAGASDDYVGHEPVKTPSYITDRTEKLTAAYADLRTDMLEEIDQVDARIMKPASDARLSIQPLKKVIKKRQDRKLDYERFQNRYESANKKTQRSEKENVALAKADSDLLRAKEDYIWADDKLKANLPPIIAATFSLLPSLLAAQIMTQNTLLGHYYTLLHRYCQESELPSSPPPASEIVAVWESYYKPIQQQAETQLVTIAIGKFVRQGARLQDERGRQASLGAPRNGNYQLRKASTQSNHSLRPSLSPSRSYASDMSETTAVDDQQYYDKRHASPSPKPGSDRQRIMSNPSQTSLAQSMPNYSASSLASPSPNEFSTPAAYAPAAPRADYFSRDRIPSTSSLRSVSSSNLASIAAGKKRPPPPPPKRIPSNGQQLLYVTALYDFAGQGHGDLVFREGDSIRVVRKTDSTDDWWEGELGGRRGSFPANYCQTAQ